MECNVKEIEIGNREGSMVRFMKVHLVQIFAYEMFNIVTVRMFHFFPFNRLLKIYLEKSNECILHMHRNDGFLSQNLGYKTLKFCMNILHSFDDFLPASISSPI